MVVVVGFVVLVLSWWRWWQRPLVSCCLLESFALILFAVHLLVCSSSSTMKLNLKFLFVVVVVGVVANI